MLFIEGGFREGIVMQGLEIRPNKQSKEVVRDVRH